MNEYRSVCLCIGVCMSVYVCECVCVYLSPTLRWILVCSSTLHVDQRNYSQFNKAIITAEKSA